jgi:putative hemolysin
MAVVFGKQVRSGELARAGSLVARLASHGSEIEAAQRLRFAVFARELGARLESWADGLDRDRFDAFCQHLLVEDTATGEVVGTYRLMLPEQARLAGALYTDGEFLTDRLAPIRDDIVELGRSCVHPDYRSGAVIMLLWAGLGELLGSLPYRYLIGCASVSTADGGHFAATLYRRLQATHGGSEALRVFPRERLPIESLLHDCEVVVPPLVKGYLRAGGQLIGEPHHDRAFGCADFPLLLSLERLEGRYSRRFIRVR